MVNEATSDLGQLLQSAKEGDGEALGQLLARLTPYVRVLVRLELGDGLRGKVGVSDVVQETFLDALRDFESFRGKTEPEMIGWLRQLLACNLADAQRRFCGTQRRDPRLERRLDESLGRSSQALGRIISVDESTPSHKASRREQASLVAEALEQLPPHYRDVLILRHLQGLSFPEIATRLDRSLGSVQKIWLRALHKLRQLVGEPP